MRPLVIDEGARAAVGKVVAHALERENYYEPGQSPGQAPGDDARHVVLLNTYRCVFSITKDPEGKLYRHLSISVPARGKYPNPFAVFAIAELFGFTGWDGRTPEAPPEDWIAGPNPDEQCVVVAQLAKDL
jgi:hypothetical protein